MAAPARSGVEGAVATAAEGRIKPPTYFVAPKATPSPPPWAHWGCGARTCPHPLGRGSGGVPSGEGCRWSPVGWQAGSGSDNKSGHWR